MATVKRQVQAAFFDAGLTLEREALNTFVAFVDENGGEEELIYSLLDSSVQGGLPSIQSQPLSSPWSKYIVHSGNFLAHFPLAC